MLALWNNYGGLNRRRSSFDEMRREMDRLLWDLDRGFLSGRSQGPDFRLVEKEDELVIEAELPGVAGKDLEITLDGGTLTIRGERGNEAPEGYRAVRRERGTLRFSHSYMLPARVDSGKATAKLEDGVLVLTLPKAEEAKPRQIPVATQ
jgi:HSP20 family protein